MPFSFHPVFARNKRFQKNPFRSAIILAVCFALAMSANSAMGERKLTGKNWIDMNYGPYMTASFQVARGNIAYKGIAVRLDKGPDGISAGREFMLFDTDTLRWAAAWTGEQFIDWHSIVFDGGHNSHPAIVGKTIFANGVGPGWGDPTSGTFEDNRLRGHDKLAYGPLSRRWAHWKGLYTHGDQVIFSYTVGSTPVLEMPAAEGESLRVMVRTLNMGPRDKDLILQVAQQSEGSFALSPFGSGQIAVHSGSKTAVAIVGASMQSASLTTNDGNLRLKIPAGKRPLRLKILIGQLADVKNTEPFLKVVRKSAPAADLAPLTRGGPAQWTEQVTTKVSILGKKDGPYIVENINAPMKNPYRSWMRLGGFDFFKDPSKAAVCTWMGDVWIVHGLGGDLGTFSWRRIATGMFQPLGLKIVDETIYVTCRDQISRLHDLNGDGQIDFYENFNNDHQVTEHFHEFAMDLQTDAAGNFYYAKSARHALDSLVPHHGTLIRVSKDGSKSQIVCNGFRAANGVGIGPNGELATSDQEGHWTPANRINLVKKGGFYGNLYSYHQGEVPKDYLPPLCWLPKGVDRSPAEALWTHSKKWGLPAGSMVSLSYGTGRVWNVMHERVGGVVQGGVVRIPMIEFPTGIMRGRFHPNDGQLYGCGLFGWAGDRTFPGGFYRIRYTGQTLNMPVCLKVLPDGIAITFSDKLDKASVEDADNYNVEQWNYRWTANYGSPHYSVLNPKKRGQDEVEIYEATLSADGKTVTLEFEDPVETVMQMKTSFNIKAADGSQVRREIFSTINAVPK